MDDDELMVVLVAACAAVRGALLSLEDWGLAGTRSGQYLSDLAADEAAIAVLSSAGLGVLSEESGLHDEGRSLFAVLDPVDGSTNASRSLPWYATSICVLDEKGPRAALVVNQSSGISYEAVRGRGARRDGLAIAPSGATELSRSIIGLSGSPKRPYGWRQYRSLGAAALDLCCVADGTLDGYVDCADRSHGPWDYLGGMLVCIEAGASVAETNGIELITRDPHERRSPVAAATEKLLGELLEQRRA